MTNAANYCLSCGQVTPPKTDVAEWQGLEACASPGYLRYNDIEHWTPPQLSTLAYYMVRRVQLSWDELELLVVPESLAARAHLGVIIWQFRKALRDLTGGRIELKSRHGWGLYLKENKDAS